MPYPPAPWTLKGSGFQTLHLVDISTARSFVPPDLDIVSTVPGKTLSSVYLATYRSGSTLEYHELIVVAALVRYNNQIGGWISHIYVDNPDSVAGGREIWGLPKELADFTWSLEKPEQVTVYQQGTLLCRFQSDWQLNLWRQSLVAPGISGLKPNYIHFNGEFTANLAIVGAKLEVPTDSPFAGLGLGNPWLAVKSQDLQLIAREPNVLGQMASVS